MILNSADDCASVTCAGVFITINYQATTVVGGAAATDVNAYKTPNTRYFNPHHQ